MVQKGSLCDEYSLDKINHFVDTDQHPGVSLKGPLSLLTSSERRDKQMPPYDHFVLETRTVLGNTGPTTSTFLLAENRDLFWIVYNDPGPPPKTAVHVLTAASGYQQFALETRTVLGGTDPATSTFLLAENRDLFWIVYDDPGPPPKTAVHVLTAASGYQQFGLETRTVLGGTDPATSTFLLAENRDLFWIVYDDPGPPPKTAVHVLTAASGYQQFGLETRTVLGGTDPATSTFLLAENRDL